MRDPRLEPRPGDVVKLVNRLIFVVRRKGDTVWYVCAKQIRDDVLLTSIGKWSVDVAFAKVIHVADN